MVYANFYSNLPTGLQNCEFVDLTEMSSLKWRQFCLDLSVWMPSHNQRKHWLALGSREVISEMKFWLITKMQWCNGTFDMRLIDIIVRSQYANQIIYPQMYFSPHPFCNVFNLYTSDNFSINVSFKISIYLLKKQTLQFITGLANISHIQYKCICCPQITHTHT